MIVLDRFEDDSAYIETDTGMQRIPRSYIQPTAKEGDVLIPGPIEGIWKVDLLGTRERKKEIEMEKRRLIRIRPKKTIQPIEGINESLKNMASEIQAVLGEANAAVCIYGSLVLHDFHLGFSDIDLLCVTKSPISALAASQLLKLKAALCRANPNDPFFPLFDAAFLPLESLLSGANDTVIRWERDGERLQERFALDPFIKMEIVESGIILCGEDFRKRLAWPTKMEIYSAVRQRYAHIRDNAFKTAKSISSCGWMLEVARCLYALKNWRVASKTYAGEWALENWLLPDPDIMRQVLIMWQTPVPEKIDPDVLDWCGSLGPPIQRFADVLERWLREIDPAEE